MKSIMFWLFMAFCGVTEATEYYDYLSGSFVEITDEVIEDGCEVEFFDQATGMYHHGEISGVNEDGDVELVDYMTGRIRYLEQQ
ncbi:MAG: hypothetical protein ACRC6V_18050 [Bacteroidales bacterium]